jgi:hypothetical protein
MSSKFNPVRDAEMFSRSLKTHFIPPGDIKAMVGWLEMPKNHNAAADAIAFAPDSRKDDAFVDFIATAPEFQGWDRSEIQAALDQANDQHLMEAGNVMENKTKTTKGTLGKLVAEAVQKGLAKALEERKASKVTISSTQLAEGIRKAVKKVLSENTMASPGRAGSGRMAGGAMPPPGKGAVAGTAAPTQEGVSDGDKVRGRSSFGQIPSPEELQQAIDDLGGWDMDLKGADSLAFEFAMMVADAGYPNMSTGEGMHKVLTALTNCPEPDALPDSVDQEELDDPDSRLNRLLDAWDARYGNESIAQTAESLASGIMDVLGWEWV